MAVENWPVGWFFCKLLGAATIVASNRSAAEPQP
jgi:hypothetical protein